MAKKIRRTLPLFFKSALPEKIIDLGSMLEFPKEYRPTNPSIIRYREGFLLCVRGVAYTLTDRLEMRGNDYPGINHLFFLNRELTEAKPLPHLDSALDGVEDIKLFSHDGKFGGIGSRASTKRENHQCEIRLIDFGHDLERATIVTLKSPLGLLQEKNWVPFSSGSELRFIYSFQPLLVLRLVGGDAVTFLNAAESDELKHRLLFLDGGSSQGIPFAGGTLMLAHRRVVRLPSLKRFYLGRVHWLNPECSHASPGPYFVINSPTIQFINGWILDEDKVYVSFGEMDDRAYLGVFDRTTFQRQFFPKEVRRP